MKDRKKVVRYLGILSVGVVLLSFGMGCSIPAPVVQPPSDVRVSTNVNVSVGPNLVDCVGFGSRTCIVVDGLLLYDDSIEGFDHMEGCTYELSIRRELNSGPDAPVYGSLSYRTWLNQIISADCELVNVESVNLTIGPELVNCRPAGNRCLQVDGKAFHSTIRSNDSSFDVYNYQTGCETEIEANRWIIDSPFGRSAYAYEYVRTLSTDCDA